MSGPAVPTWNRLLVGCVVLLLSLPLAGCVPAARFRQVEAENQALRDRVAELERELAAARAGEQLTTLYFVKSTPTEFWLVPELRPVRGEDPLRAALEELVRGPVSPQLTGLIPRETRVLGVTVRDFIAYPDFSRDITRLAVGSRGEVLVLAAIANTLIKFPGVEKVRILVEGRPVDSLAGHVDLSEPIGRNETVLLLDEAEAR